MIRAVEAKLHAQQSAVQQSKSPALSADRDFAQVFQEKLAQSSSALRFSGHAQQRLEERSIQLSAQESKAIEEAVNQADAKGSRESLVLTEKLALVVSVPNRTVITLMPKDSLNSNVFTNIDSAVIVPAGDTHAVSEDSNRPAPAWGGLDAADRPMRRHL